MFPLQEVGDVALGQILLCGAIFRSGLMLKCTPEEQTEVIQLLVTASKKKSYLNSVAYPILLDFANSVSMQTTNTEVNYFLFYKLLHGDT